MLKRIIAAVALLTLVCGAQVKRPKPNDGAVKAGVYHNNYFGFDYRVPAGFEDRTARLPQDPSGVSYGLLHVSEPQQPTRYASSVTFFADDAAYLKVKDGAQYLDQVTPRMARSSDLVGKMTSFDLSGHKFYRQDYSRRGVAAHQTILATVLKGYVLWIALNAADAQRIEQLAATVRAIKFAPAKYTPVK